MRSRSFYLTALLMIVACGPAVDSREPSQAGGGDAATSTPAAAPASEAPGPSISVSPGCDRAFAQAASIDDMHDTVEDLDPALRACSSEEEWVAAARAHPGAIDVDPVVFLRNRCDFGGPDTPLCRAVLGREE